MCVRRTLLGLVLSMHSVTSTMMMSMAIVYMVEWLLSINLQLGSIATAVRGISWGGWLASQV